MKQKKADALPGIFKSWKSLNEIPVPFLILSMNSIITILARRGVKIRDWDDRGKVVHSFKCLGSSVFLLAPRDDPGAEDDADGKNRKPGSE